MASADSNSAEPWLLPELGGAHVIGADRDEHPDSPADQQLAGQKTEKHSAGFSLRGSTVVAGESQALASLGASHAPMTRGRLDELERLAREQGYSSGRAEGYEKGYAEGEARARGLGVEQTLVQRQQLTQLIDSIGSEVSRQQESLRVIICDLIVKISTALYQREVQAASNIETIVERALQALPVGEQHVTIYLHANDLALLQDMPELLKPEWKIVADPSISEGGCRIESDHSLVDATVQRRLDEIIANTLLDPQALSAMREQQGSEPLLPANTPPDEPEA